MEDMITLSNDIGELSIYAAGESFSKAMCIVDWASHGSTTLWRSSRSTAGRRRQAEFIGMKEQRQDPIHV